MAEDFEVGEPLPEESSNRTFVLVAGVLGGLLVLSMICLGLYALVIAPRQQEARIAEATEIALQNTEVARNLTQTAIAEEASPTTVPTEAPAEEPTDSPTPTEVVVEPTDTPEGAQQTQEAQTATAQAQATLDAQQQATVTPTPTALPATGFADEAGLPGLLALGAVLVIVVFVARRMRGATP